MEVAMQMILLGALITAWATLASIVLGSTPKGSWRRRTERALSVALLLGWTMALSGLTAAVWGAIR